MYMSKSSARPCREQPEMNIVHDCQNSFHCRYEDKQWNIGIEFEQMLEMKQRSQERQTCAIMESSEHSE
jgi:hypothetical protein